MPPILNNTDVYRRTLRYYANEKFLLRGTRYQRSDNKFDNASSFIEVY